MKKVVSLTFDCSKQNDATMYQAFEKLHDTHTAIKLVKDQISNFGFTYPAIDSGQDAESYGKVVLTKAIEEFKSKYVETFSKFGIAV